MRLNIAAVAAVTLLVAACGNGGQQQMPPPDVNVAKVVKKSVTEWDEYSGHVEAMESAEIRPRVAGHLYAIHYKEGGMVEKGQLLFTIDSREYKAAADAADADAKRAEARVALAHQELKRAEELIGERAISQGELDQRRMEAQQAEADVLAAGANASRAKLDLGFTYIRAPFKGRAGEALVKPGNLVAPNETLLTTVVSVDPVYVTFTGDERLTCAIRSSPARATARARATRSIPCSSASRTRTAFRTRASWTSSTMRSTPRPGRSARVPSCRIRTASSHPACSRACASSASRRRTRSSSTSRRCSPTRTAAMYTSSATRTPRSAGT
jgi:multidrug efflux pump subunit AcrA (membrane-fusion protein)